MFGEWRGHIWKNGNDVKVQRMEKGKFGFSLKMRPPPLPLHDTTFAETFLARKLFPIHFKLRSALSGLDYLNLNIFFFSFFTNGV